VCDKSGALGNSLGSFIHHLAARTDEKPTAFVKLEAAIQSLSNSER
jgi:hypothetical protein